MQYCNVCVCVWVRVHARVLIHVQLFVTPWTVACQVPLFMEFSNQEYWSGLSFHPPGDLSDPEMKAAFSASPALAGRFFTTELPGKPISCSSLHQPPP